MSTTNYKKIVSVFFVCGAFCTVAAAAQADGRGEAPMGILDALTREFRDSAARWELAVTYYAWRLFYALLAIELVWSALVSALKGAGLQEFFADFVRKIMFFGFFLALLFNAHSWSRSIVNSFQSVGASIVNATQARALDGEIELSLNGDLKPSTVASRGIAYAYGILKAAPLNPAVALFYAAGAFVALLGFSAISVRQVLILAEMYVCLSAGVILLGFGGSRWTKEYALNYLKYAGSVGIKLMFIQISVALAISFLNSLRLSADDWKFGQVASIVLALSVLVTLVWSTPRMASDLLRGQSGSEGREVFGLGHATSRVAGSLAEGAKGGGAAVVAAARLAMAQSGTGSTEIGRALSGGVGGRTSAVANMAGGLRHPVSAEPISNSSTMRGSTAGSRGNEPDSHQQPTNRRSVATAGMGEAGNGAPADRAIQGDGGQTEVMAAPTSTSSLNNGFTTRFAANMARSAAAAFRNSTGRSLGGTMARIMNDQRRELRP